MTNLSTFNVEASWFMGKCPASRGDRPHRLPFASPSSCPERCKEQLDLSADPPLIWLRPTAGYSGTAGFLAVCCKPQEVEEEATAGLWSLGSTPPTSGLKAVESLGRLANAGRSLQVGLYHHISLPGICSWESNRNDTFWPDDACCQNQWGSGSSRCSSCPYCEPRGLRSAVTGQ